MRVNACEFNCGLGTGIRQWYHSVVTTRAAEPRVVSVSRRTDVPAFYGQWFMRRLEAGHALWQNPFGRQLHRVSLRREDVRAFVFWSRNFRPFLAPLREVKAAGFPCLFNYTITGLPKMFEPAVVGTDDAVDSLRDLSGMFSADHVNWRYDPIVFSDLTGADYHLERFAGLAARLEGAVRRCIVSFVCMYGKVRRNFALLEAREGVRVRDPSAGERRELAGRLAAIAAKHGMSLQVCCGAAAVNGVVGQAHCVDGEALSRLYFGGQWRGKVRPTRAGCGCTESTDIGCYDSCPHGCIYCYANTNKAGADEVFRLHDPGSEMLGS